MYINQILIYYNNSKDKLSNIDKNVANEFDNKIIILKKVNSIRQLKNSEKEWVRLCYKECILKGFTIIKDIQCYIASKTKIWVERAGIEYLKKSEEEENKRWYFYLAKDHFAYVGAYRKAVDEIEQYKKELWSIMSEPNSNNLEKIQATRELHNLTKTYTLLVRDLPFISNLTKYYDLNFFEDKKYNNLQQQKGNKSDESNNEEIIEQKVSERLRKMVDESALFDAEQKRKIGIISPSPSPSPTDGYSNVDDEIMASMQKQLNPTPKDILESINNKDYRESIKKLKEIREF